jgi:hypothetical protein
MRNANSRYQMSKNALGIIVFVNRKMVLASSTRIYLIKINAQKRLIVREITNSMQEIPKFLDKLALGGKNCGRTIHFR